MLEDFRLYIYAGMMLIFLGFIAYHKLSVYGYENTISDQAKEISILSTEIDKQDSAVKELKAASYVKQKKIIHYQELSQQRMKLASANALSVLKVQVPKGCEDVSTWGAIQATRMGFE